MRVATEALGPIPSVVAPPPPILSTRPHVLFRGHDRPLVRSARFSCGRRGHAHGDRLALRLFTCWTLSAGVVPRLDLHSVNASIARR